MTRKNINAKLDPDRASRLSALAQFYDLSVTAVIVTMIDEEFGRINRAGDIPRRWKVAQVLSKPYKRKRSAVAQSGAQAVA